MFGNIGQLMHLMRNAGQIKQNMGEMNERLGAARFTGEAGGGQVRATVDGRGDMVALKIEPATIEEGDIEMMEDLICAAVRDAVRNSRAGAQKEMEAAMGGMNLGGMMDMLGGGAPDVTPDGTPPE
ncbi:MAG: YbaB/EbfC family nucleoid-associated protein [Planctomycetota bacterium]